MGAIAVYRLSRSIHSSSFDGDCWLRPAGAQTCAYFGGSFLLARQEPV
jgi:hypothetical protein